MPGFRVKKSPHYKEQTEGGGGRRGGSLSAPVGERIRKLRCAYETPLRDKKGHTADTHTQEHR